MVFGQDWIGFAGDTAVALSIASATVTILDLTLSKTQRTKLELLTIRCWNWLDNQKTFPYLAMWKDGTMQIRSAKQIQGMIAFGMCVGAVISAAASIIIHGPEPLRYIGEAFGALLAAFLASRYFHPTIISWATNVETGVGYLFRSTVTVAPIVLPLMILSRFPHDYRRLESSFFGIDPAFIAVESKETGVLSFLTFILIGALLSISSVLLYFWYITVIIVPSVYFLVGAFRSAEFLLSRLVEYPKGVVAAAIGLLGATGALLKVFSGR